MKKFQEIINYIKKPIVWINSLEQREERILVENIPGYYTYQYGFKSRVIRFLALFNVCTIYHSPWLSKKFCYYWDCTFINKILDQETLLAIYTLFVVCSIIFLLIHCVFHIVIRIIFFKKIVKNSPISVAQCVSTFFKACRYTGLAFGLFLGVPGVDYLFERNGHIAPLKGFYQRRQTAFFGANEINCTSSQGKIFKKTNPFFDAISRGQEHTLFKEQQANLAFTEATKQGMSEAQATKHVLDALKKN